MTDHSDLRTWMQCALGALAVATLIGCANKDPFDKAVVEKDLKKRSLQSLYDEAEKIKYEPPADARLTEKQIADFVRMERLAAIIREVARQRADEQTDRAAAADSKSSRLSESFAAFGSLRAYATAELRASLNLHLNPHEEQWVDRQIDSSLAVIETGRTLDRQIAERKDELDAEADPLIAYRKRDAYDRAVQSKESWETQQGPAALANASLVLAHRDELKVASYPRLQNIR